MTLRLSLVLVAALFFAFPTSLRAATISLIDDQNKLGIAIAGKIESGDYQKFIRFITPTVDGDVDQIKRVGALLSGSLYLNSPGGNVGEALKIAERVAEAFVHTSVPEGGSCLSSCFLIWAAGAARRLEDSAKLGVHRLLWTGQGADVSRYERKTAPAAEAVDAFLARQGIPRRMRDRMAETAPSDMYVYTFEVLLEEGLFDAVSYRPSYRDVVERECGPHPMGGPTRRTRSPKREDLARWLDCEAGVQEVNHLREYARIGAALSPDLVKEDDQSSRGAIPSSAPKEKATPKKSIARPPRETVVEKNVGSTRRSTDTESRPLGRQDKPIPETGVMKYPFRYAMAPLTIRTSKGTHYLVKLFNAQSDQVEAVAFIRGGETLEMRMPLGSYRIRYASGTAWYGVDAVEPFGSDTTYSEADKIFHFQDSGDSVSGYTVELIKQRQGNLHSKNIPKQSFDGR